MVELRSERGSTSTARVELFPEVPTEFLPLGDARGSLRTAGVAGLGVLALAVVKEIMRHGRRGHDRRKPSDRTSAAPSCRRVDTPSSSMSSEIQRRTERTLMFNVFAIAESVEPVISMEINIWRRGSVSLLTDVMIGTAASHCLKEPLQRFDQERMPHDGRAELMAGGVRAHRRDERDMRVDHDQLHRNRRRAGLLAFLRKQAEFGQPVRIEARVVDHTQVTLRSSACPPARRSAPLR